MAYQVWIFTAAGAKTAYLENAYRVQRAVKANATPELSFTLPADDAKATYLTSAYEVKIYNTVKAQWEGLYILDDATERWDSSGSVIDVNYSGVMGQLANEDNVTYDTTSTPQTPTTIITALLALQENANPITVGTIEPTTVFSYAVENTNMLTAILQCVEYLGGYIEVDADRKLNWWNEPAGDPEREIRYRKNLRGMSRKRDFTRIVNKLYAYGYGETEAQLALSESTFVPVTCDTDHVKATTTYPDPQFYPHFLTDITTSLIGPGSQTWLSDLNENTNQRIHIDLGESKVVTYIRYDNFHASGVATTTGAKTFTLWGSNDPASFNELTYATDTGWTEIAKDVADFVQHVGSNVEDPHYINLTNTTAYRYYAFKIANNYGDAVIMGLRRIELYTAEPHPDEYVEDTTSQTAYGVRIKRITDRRITHLSTLKLWANRILALYKDPVYYYDVDVVNLAEHPGFEFDYENLEVGQIVRVVNSDMNDLSVDVKIVSVTTQLDEPENVQIELANVTHTLADSIGTVQARTTIFENVATQIGAGQVTVQGTFTVDGWRSSGQTTIDGGQITTGSVTTSQLNFTPVSSTNVVASINASAEGIQISGARISISGSTTFSSGYDPTTKIASAGAAADINNNTTTISGGKITTNTIDADAIKTSTLNAKTITLGTTGGDSIIKSGNYSAGSAGWQIKANGDAEFGSVIVRGTIETATLETSKILTVKGTIQSNNFDAGSPYPGWLINGTGDVTTHDIVCRGALVVYETVEASGTITGNNLVSTHYVTAGTYVKITPGSDPGVQNALWVNSSGYLYYRLGSTNYLLAP